MDVRVVERSIKLIFTVLTSNRYLGVNPYMSLERRHNLIRDPP